MNEKNNGLYRIKLHCKDIETLPFTENGNWSLRLVYR
jgi:hypothetical protein